MTGDDALGAPIPEGEYVLAYKRLEVGHGFGREFWAVHLVVAEGPYEGRILPRFYNPPRSRPARTSNLWRDFVALTGKRPPLEGFGPAWILKDCRVLARVVTVTGRPGKKGKRIPLAECERYSRVDSFIRITAGASPAMRGSQEGKQMPKAKKKRLLS